MKCPHCQHPEVVKFGTKPLQDGTPIQRYRCKACNLVFNARTGTPMARIRTPVKEVSFALNMRSEGMGLRASGRVLGKSHSTIASWEKRLETQQDHWSPPAPKEREVTMEGDELYTRVGENLPPRTV